MPRKRLLAALALGSLIGCDALPDPSPSRHWAYADAEKRPGTVKAEPKAEAKADPPKALIVDDGWPPKVLPDFLRPPSVVEPDKPIVKPEPPKQETAKPEPFQADGFYRLADSTGFLWQSIDRAALIEHVRRVNAGEIVPQRQAPVQQPAPIYQPFRYLAPQR